MEDDKHPPVHKEKGYAVTVNLKSLFSGQQFSFLPEEDGENVEFECLGSPGPHVRREIARQEGTQKPFFFHWSTSRLSNREECSFCSGKSRQELERRWSEQRQAIKSMLRKSHRQATQRHKHRPQTAMKFVS